MATRFSTTETGRPQLKLPYEAAAVSEVPASLAGRDESRLRLARFLVDTLAVAGAHALAWFVRFQLAGEWFHLENSGAPAYVLASVLAAMVFIGLMIAHRLYDEDTLASGSDEVQRIGRVILKTAVLFPALAYFTHTPSISRSWLALSMIFAAVFVGTERLAFRLLLARLRDRGRFRRPVILVESSAKVAPLATWSGQTVGEFEVVRHCDLSEAIAFLTRLSAEDPSSRRRRRALNVVVKSGDFSEDDLWRLLIAAGECGCPVYVESPMRSMARDRFTIRTFAGNTVTKVAPPALSGFQALRKRMFDVVASGIALLVASPFLILTAIAVGVTSGFPIFYGQERVGRNGVTFQIWKFRTMKPDAEAQSGPVWAQAKDPRRTPLGGLLRRSSMDELPQLWNVFKGDMSLVGPRPERPSFVEEFNATIAWYPYRHRMRPGLTGWAAAHGLRGNTPLDKRVEMDNWYIEHWSLSIDMITMLLTVREVFRGENAY